MAKFTIEEHTTTTDTTQEQPETLKGLKGFKARREEKEKLKASLSNFDAYPYLVTLKPKEKYVFRSDYYTADNQYCCILNFFHDDQVIDDFPAFWGINRIPRGLSDDITVVIFEQIRRCTEGWINDHISRSERLDNMNAAEQDDAGTRSTKLKHSKISNDLTIVAQEINNGDAYLFVHNRMLVKAASLESLEHAIEQITRLYIDRFGALKIAAHQGEQKQELANLFRKNDMKRSKGFYFTSSELAGSYNLVTNGLNDRNGVYVGHMVGDVNNSAVLFDVDGFKKTVVVADDARHPQLADSRMSSLWGSKISQQAMLNNQRVVHLVLDDTNLDLLGPKFERLTSKVDMRNGDINPFEMFGERKDSLAIFPEHLNKLTIMTEQANGAPLGPNIRGELKEKLNEFYVDLRMWDRNAKENFNRLRIVGIPHNDVPRLQMFINYLTSEIDNHMRTTSNDPEKLSIYRTLKGIFNDMLENNGDLFNTYTNDSIDGVNDAQRVIYDFSSLMRRGSGIAMAQLANVVGFATSSLEKGDVLIIHGVDEIEGGVEEGSMKHFLLTQVKYLINRGARVVYLYNDIDAMLDDFRFNKFNVADYTIMGALNPSSVDVYQELMNQVIPPDLRTFLSTGGQGYSYLRRGFANLIFKTSIPLGLTTQSRLLPSKARREEERIELETAMDKQRHRRRDDIDANGPLAEERRRQREASEDLMDEVRTYRADDSEDSDMFQPKRRSKKRLDVGASTTMRFD